MNILLNAVISEIYTDFNRNLSRAKLLKPPLEWKLIETASHSCTLDLFNITF